MSVEIENDTKISPDDPQYPFIISDFREGPKYLDKDDCKLWLQTAIEIKEDWRKMQEPDKQNTWNYFRAQLMITNKDRDNARELYADLIDNTGFRQYEKKYKKALMKIDIKVTGTTPRINNDLIPMF